MQEPHELEATAAGDGRGPLSETLAVTPAVGQDHAPGPLRVGDRFGRYVVLEEIGRGGMGRVLRASDTELRRDVALKEVQWERVGSEGLARLAAEARAMARLSHPNVVEVYGVEARDDRELVVVMEYVPSVTFSAWLRAAPHDWRTVLACTVAAGRGIAAAHAAGLLHRDIKPSNLLVGGSGTIKVVDFGLAKSTLDSSGSRTDVVSPAIGMDLTLTGTVMGTPRYMAPEQHRGERLTAAADQYSFCLLSWEALCGARPFDDDPFGAKKAEGPPPWPRCGVPRRIGEAVRRGLAPDPADRWPSLDALLAELEAATPVRRRGWGALVFLVGAGVGLGSWLGGGTGPAPCQGATEKLADVWGPERRAEVRDAFAKIPASFAEPAADRVTRRLDDYASRWAAAHTEACTAATVRGELAPEDMDRELACLHRARVELGAVVDLLAAADTSVVARADALTSGLAPLSRCTDLAALWSEVEPPRPEDVSAVEAVRALLAEARFHRAAGHYEPARRKVDEARALAEPLEYGPLKTELQLAIGESLDDRGDYEGAEVALREALQLATGWGQAYLTSRAASTLIFNLGRQSRPADDAAGLLRLAKSEAEDDPMALSAAHHAFAFLLEAAGDFEAAERHYAQALELRERAFGTQDFRTAMARGDHAKAMQRRGLFREAEAEQRRSLAQLEAFLGPEHPQVAVEYNNLGITLRALGRLDEAEAASRHALRLREAALGPAHPEVATSWQNLGNVHFDQGRYEEAEVEHRRALELRRTIHGDQSVKVADSHNNLGGILHMQGRLEEAEAEHRVALRVREDLLGSDHPSVAMSLTNLAGALDELGKVEDAEQALKRAIPTWEKALGPAHPTTLAASDNLATLLLGQRRFDEAASLLESTWSRRSVGTDPASVLARARTAFLLARASWETKASADDRRRARELARSALEDRAAAGRGAGDEESAQIESWLAEHREP